MARRKATVLLIDDSAVIRSALSRCINRCDDLVVINTASNGRIGVDMVRTLDPDIVVLDVEMPVMNGLEALAEIRSSHPKLPVLMFSSLTEDGAGVTLEALALGASDYTLKPKTSGIAESVRMVERELLSKIRTLVWAGRPAVGDTTTTSTVTPTTVRPGAVVVGCSTGGPVAFERLLSAIATPLPVPIYVVQHMPPKYTRVFAERLDQMTPTTVVEASDGINAQPGHCYIAPGGFHMGLRRTGGRVVIRIVDTPPIKSCKPSIEPLFMSADAAYGHNLVAVVLTGMGQDGLDGCRQISQNGGIVIAQDEATSAVWGIPGAVVRAGVATEVLPIDRIGGRVGALCAPRIAETAAAPS
ncbi:MAG: chemotaxis response regulator protein-glutamate methylesterase [Actinomycetota bacterium]